MSSDLIAWSNLGNSGTRTQIQKHRAKQIASNHINTLGKRIIAFTDGSAIGNPGPCGAGTAIYWNGIKELPSVHSRPVSELSNSYHGELQAIDLALKCIAEKTPSVQNNHIHLLTDCQSALIAATATRVPENYVNLTRSINTSVATLETQNNKIKITWIAGHTDIEGNDLADTAAKDAANETASTPESCPISTPEIRKRIKTTSIKVATQVD